jgi:hypothetical protein
LPNRYNPTPLTCIFDPKTKFRSPNTLKFPTKTIFFKNSPLFPYSAFSQRKISLRLLVSKSLHRRFGPSPFTAYSFAGLQTLFSLTATRPQTLQTNLPPFTKALYSLGLLRLNPILFK